MAPNFRHGKGLNLQVGRYDMTPYFTDTTISASLDTGEVTTYGLNDRAYIGGLADVTASFDGLYYRELAVGSSGLEEALSTALDAMTQRPITVALEHPTTGGLAALLSGVHTKLDISAPTDGVVAASLDFQGSDGYDGGIMLRPLSINTATNSNGAVNCAGTTVVGFTTGGGVGHFHLVSATTLTVGITAKIQHSTSGSTWADLITFTAATAETFQRSTVAGNVKEKLRATCSAFTGGAPKTATWSVAFARRGKIHG